MQMTLYYSTFYKKQIKMYINVIYNEIWVGDHNIKDCGVERDYWEALLHHFYLGHNRTKQKNKN